MQRKLWISVSVFFLSLFSACHSNDGPDPETLRLQQKLEDTEKEEAVVDAKLKGVGNDIGAKIQLEHDHALIHSRLERLREKTKGLGLTPTKRGE